VILTIAIIWCLLVTAACVVLIKTGVHARDNNINHESVQDWERN
jgi:hypothetical protein